MADQEKDPEALAKRYKVLITPPLKGGMMSYVEFPSIFVHYMGATPTQTEFRELKQKLIAELEWRIKNGTRIPRPHGFSSPRDQQVNVRLSPKKRQSL